MIIIIELVVFLALLLSDVCTLITVRQYEAHPRRVVQRLSMCTVGKA